LAYRFAIIGGGLTATAMLCQLMDRLAAMGDAGGPLCRALSVSVYEKEDEFGPGLPHNAKNVLPLHITNMCAQDMSVRADQPGEFHDWVLANMARSGQRPANSCASVPKAGRHEHCCHHPRALMGEYLKHQFAEAIAAAGNLEVSVERYPNTEVVDLYPGNGCVTLITNSTNGPPARAKHLADAVLLATGHWFEKSPRDTYFASPWPAAALRDAIPQSVDVAVMGSSLSAMETALTLTSDGRFLRKSSGTLSFQPSQATRKLTLYSRKGLLPRVRGRRGKRRNTHLTCGKIRDLIAAHPSAIQLSTILDLFEREISTAYGWTANWQEAVRPFDDAERLLRHDIMTAKGGDCHDGELLWQTVLAEIIPMARALYLNLSPGARKRFDSDYTTTFFMHVATQPLENAEKLLALIEAGVVTVVRLGDDYRFGYDERTGAYRIAHKDARSKAHHSSFKYVVNATGQPRAIHSDPSPLTQNLIKRLMPQSRQNGEVHPGRDRRPQRDSLKIDPESHLVVVPETDDDAASWPPLFAVGPMVRGQIIDTSMAYGLSKSTAIVADRLIAILHERCGAGA
jgi:uncharacterized NAD(P)/FAD-binding protein YdhS